MSLETILHQGKYDLSKSSGLNLTDRSKNNYNTRVDQSQTPVNS
jgi:hypothetical protein